MMEATEYKTLVLDLLSKRQYPVLKDLVVVDIHYKMIPETAESDVVRAYDKRSHDSAFLLKQHTDPYRLSYLAGNDHMFYIHEMDSLNINAFRDDCQRIKLSRSYVDTIRYCVSDTFEEELYHFITLLNFDIPKLSPLLDMNFMKCTRMLPQFIKIWVFKYDAVNIQHCPVSKEQKSCFGPPEQEGVIPTRVLRGKLAPCTSQSNILSLNNDIPIQQVNPYLLHYSDRYKTIFPLAYNPLENPLIVA